MNYKVQITDTAIIQMQETVSYISKELLSPETADRWLEKMEKEIRALSFMPGRIPLTDEEPWHSYGVHKMIIDNFLVYFWVDEKMSTVSVMAVVYGRRDQRTVLESMSL